MITSRMKMVYERFASRILLIAISFPLVSTACTTKALIADLETDKVIVEAEGSNMSIIEEEARKGCAIHNRSPIAVSKKCLDGFCRRAAYLFACK
jgi:hypothetical protein